MQDTQADTVTVEYLTELFASDFRFLEQARVRQMNARLAARALGVFLAREKPWRSQLSQDERNLIIFASMFSEHFETGTDDCKRLGLIAKLELLLDSAW